MSKKRVVFLVAYVLFLTPLFLHAQTKCSDGKPPRVQCNVNGAIQTVCDINQCQKQTQETVTSGQTGSQSGSAGNSSTPAGTGGSGQSTTPAVDKKETKDIQTCDRTNMAGLNGGVITCYQDGTIGGKSGTCTVPEGGLTCEKALQQSKDVLTGRNAASLPSQPGTPAGVGAKDEMSLYQKVQDYWDNVFQPEKIPDSVLQNAERAQSPVEDILTRAVEQAQIDNINNAVRSGALKSLTTEGSLGDWANLQQLTDSGRINPQALYNFIQNSGKNYFDLGELGGVSSGNTFSPTSFQNYIDQVNAGAGGSPFYQELAAQVQPAGTFSSSNAVGPSPFDLPSSLSGTYNPLTVTSAQIASYLPQSSASPFAFSSSVASPFDFAGTRPFVGSDPSAALSNIGEFPSATEGGEQTSGSSIYAQGVQDAVARGELPDELKGLVQDPEDVARQLEQLTPPQRQQLLDGLAANTLDRLGRNEVVSVSELNAAKAIIEESPDDRPAFFKYIEEKTGLLVTERARTLARIQDALDARSSPTNPENLAFLSNNAVRVADSGAILTDASNDPYLTELARAAEKGGDVRSTSVAEYLKARVNAQGSSMGELATERADAKQDVMQAQKALEEEVNARTNVSQNGAISGGKTFDEAETLRREFAAAQRVADDKALAANQKEAELRVANEAFAQEAQRQGLVAKEVTRTREVDTNGAIISQNYTTTEYVDPINEKIRSELERVQSDARSLIAKAGGQGGLSAADLRTLDDLLDRQMDLAGQMENRNTSIQRALSPYEASLRSAGSDYSRAFADYQQASAVAQKNLAAYAPFEQQYNTHLQNLTARAADYQTALSRSVAYDTEYSNRIRNPAGYASTLAYAPPTVRLEEGVIAQSTSLIEQYVALEGRINEVESSGLSGANYSGIAELLSWRNDQRDISARLQKLTDLQDAYNNSPDPNRFAEAYLSTYSADPKNPSMLDRYVQLRGDAQRALTSAELTESAAAGVLGPWGGPGSPSVFQDSSSLERRALADYENAINQLAGITPLTDRNLIAQSAVVSGERGSSLLGDAYTWLARQADFKAPGIEAGSNVIYSMAWQGFVKSPVDLAIRGVDGLWGLAGGDSIKPNAMLEQDAFMTRDQMGGAITHDAINTVLNAPLYAQGYSAVSGRLAIMDDAAQGSAQLAQRAQYMSEVADFVQPQSSAFLKALEAEEAYLAASKAVGQLQSPLHAFTRSADTLLAERAAAIDLARVGARLEAQVSIATIDGTLAPAQGALSAPQRLLTGPGGGVATAESAISQGSLVATGAITPVRATMAEAQAIAQWESAIAAVDAGAANLTQTQFVAQLEGANRILTEAGLVQTPSEMLVRTANPTEAVALPAVQRGAEGRLFETVGGNAPLPSLAVADVTPVASPSVTPPQSPIGSSGSGPWNMTVGDMSTAGSGSAFRNTVFGNPAFAPEGLRAGSALSNPSLSRAQYQPIIPSVATLVRPVVEPLFPAAFPPRPADLAPEIGAVVSPNPDVAKRIHGVAARITNKATVLDDLAEQLRATNPSAATFVEKESARVDDVIREAGSLAVETGYENTFGAQALLLAAQQLNDSTYPELPFDAAPREAFDVLLARAEVAYSERGVWQTFFDNLFGPLLGPARDLAILREVQRDLLPGGVSPAIGGASRASVLGPSAPLRIFGVDIPVEIVTPISPRSGGDTASFTISPSPAVGSESVDGVMSAQTAKLIREALAAGGISDSPIVGALREIEAGNGNGTQLLRDAASPSSMSNSAFKLHTDALEKGLQNDEDALDAFLEACGQPLGLNSIMLAAAILVPAAAQCSSEPLANEVLKLESDFQGIQVTRELWGVRGGYPSEVAGAVDALKAAVTEARSSVGLLRGNPTSAGLRANAERKVSAGKDLVVLIRGVEDFKLFSEPSSAALRESFAVQKNDIVARGGLAQESYSDPPESLSDASRPNPLEGVFGRVLDLVKGGVAIFQQRGGETIRPMGATLAVAFGYFGVPVSPTYELLSGPIAEQAVSLQVGRPASVGSSWRIEVPNEMMSARTGFSGLLMSSARAGELRNKPEISEELPSTKTEEVTSRDYSDTARDFTENKLLSAINEYRAEYGLSPLVANNRLTSAAQRHAYDLASLNRISHYGSDGSDAGARAKRAGYKPEVVAENVAVGQTSIQEVIEGWKKSPGHNRNLLDPEVTEIGAALVINEQGYRSFYALTLAKPVSEAREPPVTQTNTNTLITGEITLNQKLLVQGYARSLNVNGRLSDLNIADIKAYVEPGFSRENLSAIGDPGGATVIMRTNSDGSQTPIATISPLDGKVSYERTPRVKGWASRVVLGVGLAIANPSQLSPFSFSSPAVAGTKQILVNNVVNQLWKDGTYWPVETRDREAMALLIKNPLGMKAKPEFSQAILKAQSAGYMTSVKVPVNSNKFTYQPFASPEDAVAAYIAKISFQDDYAKCVTSGSGDWNCVASVYVSGDYQNPDANSQKHVRQSGMSGNTKIPTANDVNGWVDWIRHASQAEYGLERSIAQLPDDVLRAGVLKYYQGSQATLSQGEPVAFNPAEGKDPPESQATSILGAKYAVAQPQAPEGRCSNAMSCSTGATVDSRGFPVIRGATLHTLPVQTIRKGVVLVPTAITNIPFNGHNYTVRLFYMNDVWSERDFKNKNRTSAQRNLLIFHETRAGTSDMFKIMESNASNGRGNGVYVSAYIGKTNILPSGERILDIGVLAPFEEYYLHAKVHNHRGIGVETVLENGQTADAGQVLGALLLSDAARAWNPNIKITNHQSGEADDLSGIANLRYARTNVLSPDAISSLHGSAAEREALASSMVIAARRLGTGQSNLDIVVSLKTAGLDGTKAFKRYFSALAKNMGGRADLASQAPSALELANADAAVRAAIVDIQREAPGSKIASVQQLENSGGNLPQIIDPRSSPLQITVNSRSQDEAVPLTLRGIAQSLIAERAKMENRSLAQSDVENSGVSTGGAGPAIFERDSESPFSVTARPGIRIAGVPNVGTYPPMPIESRTTFFGNEVPKPSLAADGLLGVNTGARPALFEDPTYTPVTYVPSGSFTASPRSYVLLNPNSSPVAPLTQTPFLPQSEWVYFIGKSPTSNDIALWNSQNVRVVKIDPNQTSLETLQQLKNGTEDRVVIGYFNGAANQPGEANRWMRTSKSFQYPVSGYETTEGHFPMNEEGVAFQIQRFRTHLDDLKKSGKLDLIGATGYDNIFGCFENARCRADSNLTAAQMVLIVERLTDVAHEYGKAFVLKNPHTVFDRFANNPEAFAAMLKKADAVIAEQPVEMKELAAYAGMPDTKPLYVVEFGGSMDTLRADARRNSVTNVSFTVTSDGYTNPNQTKIALGEVVRNIPQPIIVANLPAPLTAPGSISRSAVNQGEGDTTPAGQQVSGPATPAANNENTKSQSGWRAAVVSVERRVTDLLAYFLPGPTKITPPASLPPAQVVTASPPLHSSGAIAEPPATVVAAIEPSPEVPITPPPTPALNAVVESPFYVRVVSDVPVIPVVDQTSISIVAREISASPEVASAPQTSWQRSSIAGLHKAIRDAVEGIDARIVRLPKEKQEILKAGNVGGSTGVDMIRTVTPRIQADIRAIETAIQNLGSNPLANKTVRDDLLVQIGIARSSANNLHAHFQQSKAVLWMMGEVKVKSIGVDHGRRIERALREAQVLTRQLDTPITITANPPGGAPLSASVVSDEAISDVIASIGLVETLPVVGALSSSQGAFDIVARGTDVKIFDDPGVTPNPQPLPAPGTPLSQDPGIVGTNRQPRIGTQQPPPLPDSNVAPILGYTPQEMLAQASEMRTLADAAEASGRSDLAATLRGASDNFEEAVVLARAGRPEEAVAIATPARDSLVSITGVPEDGVALNPNYIEDIVRAVNAGDVVPTTANIPDTIISRLDEWRATRPQNESSGGGGVGAGGGGSGAGGSGGGSGATGGSGGGAGSGGVSWRAWAWNKCSAHPRLCGTVVGVLGLGAYFGFDTSDQADSPPSQTGGSFAQGPSFGAVKPDGAPGVTTSRPPPNAAQPTGGAEPSNEPTGTPLSGDGSGARSGSSSGAGGSNGAGAADGRGGGGSAPGNRNGNPANGSAGAADNVGGGSGAGIGGTGAGTRTGSTNSNSSGGFSQGGMSIFGALLQGLMSYLNGGDESSTASNTGGQQTIATSSQPLARVGTIVANPSLIDSGSTTTLSWSSVGTDVSSSTCAIINADFSVLHRGGQNGSISSGILTESTRFGLVCNTNNAADKLLHETLVRVRGDESDPERIFSPEEIARSQSMPASVGSSGGVSGGTGAGGQNSSGQSGNPAPRDVRTCDPEQSMDSFIRCLCEAEPNPAGCTIPSGGLR